MTRSGVARRRASLAFLRGFSLPQCCVKVLRLGANLCAVMVGSSTRWTDGAHGNAIYPKGPQRRADGAHLCATLTPGLPGFPIDGEPTVDSQDELTVARLEAATQVGAVASASLMCGRIFLRRVRYASKRQGNGGGVCG